MRKNATYLAKTLLFSIILLCSVYVVSAGGVSHMVQASGTNYVPLSYDTSYYKFAFSIKANHTFVLNTVYLNLKRTATAPKWYYTVSIYASNSSTGTKKPTGSALASSGIYPASQLGTTVSSLYHNLTTNLTLVAGTYYHVVIAQYNGSASTTVYVDIASNIALSNWTNRGYANGTWIDHDYAGRDGVYNLYGYTYTGSPGHPQASIKAYDYYNNNSIENFTVKLNNGTTRVTTNGTVNTLLPIGTYSFNVTFIRDTTSGQYFNLTGQNITLSTNATTYTKPVYPKQSQINFTNRRLMYNTTLTGVTYYVNNTLGTTFYLRAGNNYVVKAVKTGYFNVTKTFNVSALDNKTVNVTGLYDARVLISPRDVLNNNTINNANITLRNSTYTYYITGTNVTNKTFNLSTGKYLLTIEAPERKTYNYTVNLNTTGSSTFYAYMYAYNSVLTYAYDQETGSAITTFNVSIYNANNSYSNSTHVSYSMIDNIISGNYTVVVSATNYTSAYYTVTVTDNSNQTLNAFLTSATDVLTFTIRNKNTGEAVDGATIIQKRIINGSLTTVSTKTSDIAGASTFIFGGGIVYTFVISKTGFITRTFNFEPALSAYTVLLTPNISTNPEIRINDVTYTIDAYKFANNNLSYITVTFNSAEGTLEYYRVYINNSYNSTLVSGVNANGGTLNATRYLTGVTIGSTTKVTIVYKSTLDLREYRRDIKYTIRGYAIGTSTLEDIKGDLGKLGDFEKAFIGTLIASFIMIAVSIAGSAFGQGVTGGAIGGLFGFGIASYMGFFPTPVIYVTVFIFGLLIVSRINNDG